MLKTFLLWGLTFLLVQNYISPTLAEKPSKTLSDKEVEVLDALEFNEGPVIITRYSVNVFWFFLKFIYSEKATKFCEIFTLLLSYVVPVKSKVLKSHVGVKEVL